MFEICQSYTIFSVLSNWVVWSYVKRLPIVYSLCLHSNNTDLHTDKQNVYVYIYILYLSQSTLMLVLFFLVIDMLLKSQVIIVLSVHFNIISCCTVKCSRPFLVNGRNCCKVRVSCIMKFAGNLKRGTGLMLD